MKGGWVILFYNDLFPGYWNVRYFTEQKKTR